MSAETPEPGSVLIVDDDPAIREILAELLTDEGYDVVTAANGNEALRRLGNGGKYCMVLLDLMMPVMDGWEFRSLQLADPRLNRVPVVVFSGADNLAQQAADLNVGEYLEKPVDADRLLNCISQHCKAPRDPSA